MGTMSMPVWGSHQVQMSSCVIGQSWDPNHDCKSQLSFSPRVQYEVDQFWAQLEASKDACNLEGQDVRIPAGKDFAYLNLRNAGAAGVLNCFLYESCRPQMKSAHCRQIGTCPDTSTEISQQKMSNAYGCMLLRLCQTQSWFQRGYRSQSKKEGP